MRVIRGDFRKSNKEFMEGMESDGEEQLRDQRMEEMIQRYKQRDEAEHDMYYKPNSNEE